MRQLYKLSQKERSVISNIEFDSERPARQIAKSIKSTGSAVTYALRSLTARGIISPRAIINFYKLGYVNFAIFFCLESETRKQHTKLFQYLENHSQVAWLGSLAGEYHYGLAFFARNIREVHQLLFDASDKYGVTFAHKTIIPRVSITFYPRAYLHQKETDKTGITIQAETQVVSIDDADQRILRALANSQYTSLRDIARITGLTASKVERHVHTMEEQGIIARRIFAVNSESLGVHSYRLLIQLNRISKRTKDLLLNFCKSCSYIILFMESLGEWDFEMSIEVPDPNQVASITRQLYEICEGDLRRVQILSELEDLKFSLFPF